MTTSSARLGTGRATPSPSEVVELLADRPASRIASHPGACCELARGWFAGLSRFQHPAARLSPAWIRDRWDWGPHSWPIHWCEIAASETADCGVLAALAAEAFEALGVPTLSVQLLERFDHESIEDWEHKWQRAPGTRWTFGDLAYHEAVAPTLDSASSGDRLRVWDPTDSCWIDEKLVDGYGGLVAVRFLNRGGTVETVSWRGAAHPVGEWVVLIPETEDTEAATHGETATRVAGSPPRR